MRAAASGRTTSHGGPTIECMDATSSRVAGGSQWDAAVDLARDVAAGAALPTLASPVLLDIGEALHADVFLEGWRYCAIDVAYEEPYAAAIGGPMLFGIATTGSAIARRRARRGAEALAPPRWRPLGPLRVLATNQRLLVWHDSAWASVWYEAIRELHPALEVDRFDLTFANDPPYCFAGSWAPYLAVVIATLVATREQARSRTAARRT